MAMTHEMLLPKPIRWSAGYSSRIHNMDLMVRSLKGPTVLKQLKFYHAGDCKMDFGRCWFGVTFPSTRLYIPIYLYILYIYISLAEVVVRRQAKFVAQE